MRSTKSEDESLKILMVTPGYYPIKGGTETIVHDLTLELKKKGIATRRIFIPLVEFPPYFEKDKGRYPYAYRIYERGLTLPGSTLNSERDIKASASALINLL